jgi:multiple sugar transport system ATP-binding protein
MFVAGFIGSPAMNLLRGRVDDSGVWLGEHCLGVLTKHRGDVVVGIRPEALTVDGEGQLEMPVVLSEMLGSDVLLHLDAPAESALTADMLDAGEDLVEDSGRFIARVPPNVRPAPGEKVRLRVDLDRVHLFDPETEAVIQT